jgi:hypothetical protein
MAMELAFQEQFLQALNDVDFPAPRERILRAARDAEGLDEHVLQILEQLPDRTYEGSSDLADEIERFEPPTSIDGEVQSADEAGVVGATRDIIADAADET